MACSHCNNTGWKNVTFTSGGKAYSGMEKCECRKKTDAAGGFQSIGDLRLDDRAIAKSEDKTDWSSEKPMERKQPTDAEIEGGGGIQYAAARAANLPRPDCEIAAIILNHRGKKNAVTIESICKMLWPDDWQGLDLYKVQIAFGEQLAKDRNNLIRSVKASVERIRTEARVPVASCKGMPGGYYIPVTAEECDDCHNRLFGEGIKLIRLSQLFKRDTDLVEELRGQLRITSSEL